MTQRQPQQQRQHNARVRIDDRCARAAAAEIEAWKMPTDDDIAGLADGQGFTCWAGAVGESVVIDYVGFARALIALLFGGGRSTSSRSLRAGRIPSQLDR